MHYTSHSRHLRIVSAFWVLSTMIFGSLGVNSQLPDDIQRELNQNLAEQARQQHLQQQINQLQQQQRQLAAKQPAAAPPPQPHPVASARTTGAGQDPNNYSFNQVAPPIQYSYYRPYGDNQPQQQQPAPVAPQTQRSHHHHQQQQQHTPPQQNLGNDFGGFDFNQPSANHQQQPLNSYQPPAAQQQQYQAQPVPSFTGAGGLPSLQGQQQPLYQQQGGNAGAAPAAQQGPPLTENDFKDITEGHNYGAPGDSDFGLGNVAQNGGTNTGTNTDAQLREFGLPADNGGQTQHYGNTANIPDLGSLGGGPAGNSGNSRSGGLNIPGFGSADNFGSGGGGGGSSGLPFTGNSNRNSGGGGGQINPNLGGGLFPQEGAYEAGPASSSSNGNSQSAAPGGADDGAINISDLGENPEQLAGTNLPGLDGQQQGGGDGTDFNFAAASEQQPASVPYPDGAPQPVGSIFVVTQPQSLSSTRYNPLPDKGTYQDYPAYHFGPIDFDSVSDVVHRTPPARRPGPGRYSSPQLGRVSRVQS